MEARQPARPQTGEAHPSRRARARAVSQPHTRAVGAKVYLRVGTGDESRLFVVLVVIIAFCVPTYRSRPCDALLRSGEPSFPATDMGRCGTIRRDTHFARGGFSGSVGGGGRRWWSRTLASPTATLSTRTRAREDQRAPGMGPANHDGATRSSYCPPRPVVDRLLSVLLTSVPGGREGGRGRPLLGTPVGPHPRNQQLLGSVPAGRPFLSGRSRLKRIWPLLRGSHVVTLHCGFDRAGLWLFHVFVLIYHHLLFPCHHLLERQSAGTSSHSHVFCTATMSQATIEGGDEVYRNLNHDFCVLLYCLRETANFSMHESENDDQSSVGMHGGLLLDAFHILGSRFVLSRPVSPRAASLGGD